MLHVMFHVRFHDVSCHVSCHVSMFQCFMVIHVMVTCHGCHVMGFTLFALLSGFACASNSSAKPSWGSLGR